MKNKLIFNILIVYFFVLGFILLFQVNSKDVEAIEPLPTEIKSQDKLKNAVVLCLNSPILLVNEKQVLIDEQDATITPIIQDEKVYIPVILLKKAFGGNINFSSLKKEITFRLDNKAIIFSNQNTKIKVIDINNEKTFETEYKSKIISDRFYIPLTTFADIFNKQVFIHNNLIIISNIPNIFDSAKEIDTIQKILNKVEFLPVIGNYENLKKLVSKFDEEKMQASLTLPAKNINQQDNLQTNNKYFIKNIQNLNFYINNKFLEAFNLIEGKENFAFKLELKDANLTDIIVYKNKLILCFVNEKCEFSDVFIYDISDFANVKLLNQVSLTGNIFNYYIYKNYLYIFTNSTINKNNSNMQVFAKYKFNDSKIEENSEEVFLNAINYFPDINDNLFTSIVSINLDNLNENINKAVFFGMGKNILIDKENLFVATNYKNKSNIYLFNFHFGKLKFINRVSLDKEILNISKAISLDKDIIKMKISEIEEKIYNKNFEQIY